MTMSWFRSSLPWMASASICLAFATSCTHGPKAGEVKDEALRAGRAAASFPAADEDYFHDMDGGIALTSDEVKGRDMWLLWTGGNDRFWDSLATSSVGIVDLLKTVSSYPSYKFTRDNR